MKLDSKENLLSKGLKKFYSQGNNLDIVIQIIGQKTTISLRLLDWLATNYSKKHRVFYELSDEVIDGYVLASNNFDMYSEYKNQLKAANKKYFDPFSRSQRILVTRKNNNIEYTNISKNEIKELDTNSNTDIALVTTIGQLNFFKWAITYGVIDYASKNRDAIEEDMLNTIKERKGTDNVQESTEIESGKSETGTGTGIVKVKDKQKRTLSKTNHLTRSSSKKIIVQFI